MTVSFLILLLLERQLTNVVGEHVIEYKTKYLSIKYLLNTQIVKQISLTKFARILWWRSFQCKKYKCPPKKANKLATYSISDE